MQIALHPRLIAVRSKSQVVRNRASSRSRPIPDSPRCGPTKTGSDLVEPSSDLARASWLFSPSFTHFRGSTTPLVYKMSSIRCRFARLPCSPVPATKTPSAYQSLREHKRSSRACCIRNKPHPFHKYLPSTTVHEQSCQPKTALLVSAKDQRVRRSSDSYIPSYEALPSHASISPAYSRVSPSCLPGPPTASTPAAGAPRQKHCPYFKPFSNSPCAPLLRADDNG